MLHKELMTIFGKTITGKPVWVFFAVAIVSAPCLAETPSVDRAKITPELSSGGKVQGKDLDKRPVQLVAAKLGKDGGVNSSAKGSGSITATKIALNLKSAENADKRHSQSDSPSGWDYLQYALLGLLAWIPLAATFIKTPNVESNGLAATNATEGDKS